MDDATVAGAMALDLVAQLRLLQDTLDMLLLDPAMADAGMVEHLSEARRLVPGLIERMKTAPTRVEAPEAYRDFDIVFRVIHEARQRLPSMIPSTGLARRQMFRSSALYYESVAKESLDPDERDLAKAIADDVATLSCAARPGLSPAVDEESILERIRERQRRLTALGFARHLLTRSSGASFVN